MSGDGLGAPGTPSTGAAGPTRVPAAQREWPGRGEGAPRSGEWGVLAPGWDSRKTPSAAEPPCPVLWGAWGRRQLQPGGVCWHGSPASRWPRVGGWTKLSCPQIPLWSVGGGGGRGARPWLPQPSPTPPGELGNGTGLAGPRSAARPCLLQLPDVLSPWPLQLLPGSPRNLAAPDGVQLLRRRAAGCPRAPSAPCALAGAAAGHGTRPRRAPRAAPSPAQGSAAQVLFGQLLACLGLGRDAVCCRAWGCVGWVMEPQVCVTRWHLLAAGHQNGESDAHFWERRFPPCPSPSERRAGQWVCAKGQIWDPPNPSHAMVPELSLVRSCACSPLS